MTKWLIGFLTTMKACADNRLRYDTLNLDHRPVLKIADFAAYFSPGGITIPKHKENRENMKTKTNKPILYQPLVDEFVKYGDRFLKVAHNESNGMYCYRRTTSDGLIYYEVFKAPRAKDENGVTYQHYPSTSQFGFGVALCIRGNERHSADKIAFYITNGFAAGRYRPFG